MRSFRQHPRTSAGERPVCPPEAPTAHVLLCKTASYFPLARPAWDEYHYLVLIGLVPAQAFRAPAVPGGASDPITENRYVEI
jgi:hypothetical protein